MTVAEPMPVDFGRRSPIHRLHAALGARFRTQGDALVVAHHGDPESERAVVATLALRDATTLAREGFKGRGTVEWLGGQGVQVPAVPNQATLQDDGSLCLRLGETEVLLLQPPEAPATHGRLTVLWEAAHAADQSLRIGWPVPRSDSHGWFILDGACAAATLAKVCAVDLSPRAFAPLAVAQTQLAGPSVIVCRDPTEAVLRYHVLADVASTEYLWEVLLDAMQEFGGRPVGFDAASGRD